VKYTPSNTDGSKIREWAGTLKIAQGDLPPTLVERLSTLFQITETLLPARSIPFPDGTSKTAGRPSLIRIIVQDQSPDIEAHTGEPSHLNLAARILRTAYTLDGQRIIADVFASIEAECWKDLAARMGETLSERHQLQVFISYRRRPDIEQFSETVALRIEREGTRARFDKWDMVAGDSLVGKVEEAFTESKACLIILSKDFRAGRWATTEMQTAITKRVNEGYRRQMQR
jgi:hypothetical protein